MKAGSTLTSVAQRIEDVTRSARDFLARPAQVRVASTPGDQIPNLILDDGTGALSFGASVN